MTLNSADLDPELIEKVKEKFKDAPEELDRISKIHFKVPCCDCKKELLLLEDDGVIKIPHSKWFVCKDCGTEERVQKLNRKATVEMWLK